MSYKIKHMFAISFVLLCVLAFSFVLVSCDDWDTTSGGIRIQHIIADERETAKSNQKDIQDETEKESEREPQKEESTDAEKEFEADKTDEEFVWIPKSGTKYHRRADCSGMKNPRKVTKEEAINDGYEPCKKCCG